MPETKTDSKSTAGGRMLLSVLEWVELFAFSFAAVLVVITFIARHAPVVGTSMTNTLQNSDVLIVRELFYQPKPNDIVVLQSGNLGYQEPLVKRIIAVGGQTVKIDYNTWTVSVDGVVLDEDYIRYTSDGKNDISREMAKQDGMYPMRGEYPELYGVSEYSVTVPEGYVFVMGDNRNGSTDSRFSQVGLVDARCVIGEVVFRLFPLTKMRTF